MIVKFWDSTIYKIYKILANCKYVSVGQLFNPVYLLPGGCFYLVKLLLTNYRPSRLSQSSQFSLLSAPLSISISVTKP